MPHTTPSVLLTHPGIRPASVQACGSLPLTQQPRPSSCFLLLAWLELLELSGLLVRNLADRSSFSMLTCLSNKMGKKELKANN